MPLSFDYPLEKITTYTGCNPRPPDFDDFWERGLAEMRATLVALDSARSRLGRLSHTYGDRRKTGFPIASRLSLSA